MYYPENLDGDKTAPGGFASRDFLVLFLVDQRLPLKSKSSIIVNPTYESRLETRNKLFIEQITPT